MNNVMGIGAIADMRKAVKALENGSCRDLTKLVPAFVLVCMRED